MNFVDVFVPIGVVFLLILAVAWILIFKNMSPVRTTAELYPEMFLPETDLHIAQSVAEHLNATIFKPGSAIPCSDPAKLTMTRALFPMWNNERDKAALERHFHTPAGGEECNTKSTTRRRKTATPKKRAATTSTGSPTTKNARSAGRGSDRRKSPRQG